ncbi:MAG TPA: tripartite tricarboxylate transporter substrate binding protein [Xanthobacteraceae bacterium]|nr:tripartite tricarboxylate transporter substrate binding protein [Xanthobacteraceae bacterium]
MKSMCRLFAAMTSLMLAGPVAAEDFPARPITIVVPYTAGGSTDIMARLIGQKLEERLGKPVVVELKPGAGTAIGATAVVKSAPDGYTLLMATPTPMAINVTLHKNLGYDPAADFVPLVLIAQAPFILIVHPSLPVKSVQELVNYAKANPGKLSYGSGGPGAPHHLYAELLKSMTGIQMTHVPYKGTMPALNDVVAGHIQLMFSDIPPAIGMVQSGKVRPLGVSTKARVAAFPNVPTIDESGVPGFDVAGWFMIVAPAKTPEPVVAKLHAELKAIVASPAVSEQIAKLSLLPMKTPSIADMRAFVKSEIVRWGKVVQTAGIAGTE